MAVALVQTSTEIAFASGTTGNVTVTGVGAGNLLVCVVASNSNTPTVSVSDDKGNTWAEAVALGSAGVGRRASIWYAKNTAAGDTVVTVTMSVSATAVNAFVYEVSGCDTTSPLDASSSLAETTTTTSHNCSADATVIDTTAECFVCCASKGQGSFGTLTEGSGYTRTASASASSMFQRQIFGASTANERGAFTSGTSQPAVGAIAAFKVAAAAGGRTTKNTRAFPLGTEIGMNWGGQV